MARLGVAMTLMLAGVLSACASTTETNPGRTATEQLLVSRAADMAVEGLVLPIPVGARIFVDDTYFQAESARYAVGAIRAARAPSRATRRRAAAGEATACSTTSGPRNRRLSLLRPLRQRRRTNGSRSRASAR